MGLLKNKFIFLKKVLHLGTSLAVQWLRLRARNAGGPGLIPGWGTRSHMHAAIKSLHAATKDPTCCNEDPEHSNKDPTCRS